MKKIVKWIFIAVIVIAGIGAGVFYAMQPLVFELYTVAPSEASVYFIEQGFVKASEEVAVYPVVSGELVAMNVTEDQTVSAGDVLCVVDSSQINFEIEKSESDLNGYAAQINNLDLEEKQQKDSLLFNRESLQAEYDALLAQESTATVSKEDQIRLQNVLIAQSQEDIRTAADKLEKGRILYESNVLPKSDYDDLVTALTAAESALETNLENLALVKTGQGQTSTEYFESMKDSLSAQMRSIDNTVASSYTGAMKDYYRSLIASTETNIGLLNKKIADCTITSPVSGQITQLNIKNLNIVSPEMPVAVITTERTDDIEVFVATKDIGEVALGNTVELTAKRQKGDLTISGTVTAVDDEATVKLSALGVEERKVKVTVKPEKTDTLLLQPGYDVDVKFVTYQAADQLTIPKTATFEKEGKDYVWRVVNGAAEETEIVLGIELRTAYVVSSGLSADDIVIKDVNQEGLGEGVKIKID